MQFKTTSQYAQNGSSHLNLLIENFSIITRQILDIISLQDLIILLHKTCIPRDKLLLSNRSQQSKFSSRSAIQVLPLKTKIYEAGNFTMRATKRTQVPGSPIPVTSSLSLQQNKPHASHYTVTSLSHQQCWYHLPTHEGWTTCLATPAARVEPRPPYTCHVVHESRGTRSCRQMQYLICWRSFPAHVSFSPFT